MAIPSVPRTPTNPNTLPSNKFAVQIATLPDVQYWAQTVNIPGISIGEALRNTPFTDLWSPGDKANYNPLSFTFILDEDFKTWTSIFNWMTSLTFTEKFEQYQSLAQRLAANKPQPQFSDISVTILNVRQVPNLRVSFKNCFPTSLSDVILSTTFDQEDTLTADVTFRYDLFHIDHV